MTRLGPVLAVAALMLGLVATGPVAAGAAAATSPFAPLAGRWTGDGRLGLGEGKIETVSCRATYFVSDDGLGLQQNVRCASAGGKVEVKSEVKNDGGKLSGSWSELIYEKSGQLEGEITPRGYRISVKGEDLSANMEIIVRDDKQIVEIQFHHSTLVGLTLVLNRG